MATIRMMDRRPIILISLAFFIPAIVLLSLSLGVVGVNPLSILLGGENSGSIEQAVFWSIRLPRALMGLISGAVLALTGATLQGALKNPLVSPFTIGISSGASFGAALAIVLGVGLAGIGPFLIVGNAFLFALIAAAIVMGISKLKGMTPESVILAGIAIMYLFSASVTILQYVAHEWQLKALVYWLMGDLARANWKRVELAALSIIACIPLFKYAWDLNVLTIGEETAKSLGTDPGKTRLACIAFSALAVAIIISFTGPIAFICLVSPHIARLLLGADHRFLLIGSALIGSLLLTSADLAARVVIAPFELPVGVLTAFIGAPLFIHLLLRARREVWL